MQEVVALGQELAQVLVLEQVGAWVHPSGVQLASARASGWV